MSIEDSSGKTAGNPKARDIFLLHPLAIHLMYNYNNFQGSLGKFFHGRRHNEKK
jgi:hypothetical protein